LEFNNDKEKIMRSATTPHYGSPQVIQLARRPRPLANDHDIIVEVEAAAVTAGDVRMRSADFPGISALPGRMLMGVSRPRNEVQGTMFAGRVVEVGEEVKRFAPGDRVFGSVDHGAYATFVRIHEDMTIAKIPDDIGFIEAASVPYGAVTALYFLQHLADLQPGERVLIVGASGGVGQYAVQIAKYLGAEVTGVCSEPNALRVLELGADRVIDYQTENYLSSGETYDVIFDIQGVTGFWQARNALSARGRFITLLVSFAVLMQMAATSILGGKRAIFGVALGGPDQLAKVADLLSCGAIRPVPGAVFPFDEIARAHETAQSRRSNGTVIVRGAGHVITADIGAASCSRMLGLPMFQ